MQSLAPFFPPPSSALPVQPVCPRARGAAGPAVGAGAAGGVTPKGLLNFLSAGTGGPGFRRRLAQDPDIAAKLSPEELERAFDLAHHLRWSNAIIDRALREHA